MSLFTIPADIHATLPEGAHDFDFLFSANNERTWETNWMMQFRRPDGAATRPD
jgi:hypothetical protein